MFSNIAQYLLLNVFYSSLLFLALPTTASATPRVVVSIIPVHSLVTAIMESTGTPTLLLKSYASPHTYQMRPSQARQLSNADVVFWIGPTLETFLKKAIGSLEHHTQIVTLLMANDLTLYPYRKGGDWRSSDHPSEKKLPHNENNDDSFRHLQSVDPHIWLDPQNVKQIIDKIVTTLSQIDTVNSQTYFKNGEKLKQRVSDLDRELAATLAPVVSRPYLVFHDAFQYLERYYALNAAGAVSVNPEQNISAFRISQLRKTIQAINIQCIFSEPQFPASLINTIIEGSEVRRAQLDPFGATLSPGSEAFFTMMKSNVSAIATCLSNSIADE